MCKEVWNSIIFSNLEFMYLDVKIDLKQKSTKMK